jgi:hypothetical protein
LCSMRLCSVSYGPLKPARRICMDELSLCLDEKIKGLISSEAMSVLNDSDFDQVYRLQSNTDQLN